MRKRDKSGQFRIKYFPLVPYQKPEKVIENIAKAILSNYGKYKLFNWNCEHFTNQVIYGISFSEQVEHWKRFFLADKRNIKREIKKSGQFFASLDFGSAERLTRKIEEIKSFFKKGFSAKKKKITYIGKSSS